MFRSTCFSVFFFFNDTATTEIYTLSLHDALPILGISNLLVRLFMDVAFSGCRIENNQVLLKSFGLRGHLALRRQGDARSEEHTSELQSRLHLVFRLLLEKKNNHP